MSTRPIEMVYQELGTLINEAIPEPWRRAWIIVELEGATSLDMTGRYEAETSPEPRTFAIPHKAVRNLAELRRRLGASDKPWKRATFHLLPDGKFKLDLEY